MADKSLIYLFLISLLCACGSPGEESKITTFQGTEKAVTLAGQMFDAIGGMERWRNLRSLYIKAQHTEPQMDKPYQSQIWRATDHFKIRTEQGNEDFYVIGEVSQAGGKITYLDQRDTFRILTPAQLAEWEHEHDHNVYVVLHQLAQSPENYTVKLEEKDRLTFYRDTQLLAACRLDAQFRPYLFYAPDTNGTLQGTEFTRWGTTEGLVHSAGGHPLDSNFIYNTEIWEPSNLSFEEQYHFDFK